MTQARPGEWVVISGVGGLGHVAVQYAKAMGLNVAAVDLGAGKMNLARSLGADLTIDAATEQPADVIQKQIGGAHGVLVTAVSLAAFRQALGMLRRGGTCVACGKTHERVHYPRTCALPWKSGPSGPRKRFGLCAGFSPGGRILPANGVFRELFSRPGRAAPSLGFSR